MAQSGRRARSSTGPRGAYPTRSRSFTRARIYRDGSTPCVASAQSLRYLALTAAKDVDKPRALLLTKDKKLPILWQTLSVKYGDRIQFASHRDRKGKTSVTMGMEAGERDESKVLIYPVGHKDYVRFEGGRHSYSLNRSLIYPPPGLLKYDSLSKFFDSVLDGTADLTIANKEAAAEEYTPSDEELEIQRKQEAQRIALAHGGFSDLIDFEKAVLDGAGSNFHDTNGFGMMGSYAKKKPDADEQETPGATKPSAATPEAEATAAADAKTSKEDGSAPSPEAESPPVHTKDEL